MTWYGIFRRFGKRSVLFSAAFGGRFLDIAVRLSLLSVIGKVKQGIKDAMRV
jgi:hypothetical protein